MERSLSKIRDVDLKILMELDDKDLLSFCLTSKYGKSLCDNEDFWRQRFVQRFGEHEKTLDRTWKNFYLNLIYYLDKNKNYYFPINISMRQSAKGGMKNIDIIKYFISQGANWWNWGMYGAVEGGDRDLVDFFINKGADDWNYGMTSAALKGHRDLVEFFISQGARNWNDGMYFAAEGGHKDLVDFFISQGADAWNLGMMHAAKGGHRDLVDFFISKGANNWDGGLEGATLGEHQDLLEFFKNKIDS